jgi:hypothetical protein
MIEIALSARRLSGWHGRCPPGDIRKIKKLGHVHLGCVPLGETGKVKPCFNQLEPCRVIRNGVRDIVLLRKWGYLPGPPPNGPDICVKTSGLIVTLFTPDIDNQRHPRRWSDHI